MSRKRVFRTQGPQEPKADPSLSRDERGLDSERPASPSRRGFLWKAGGIAAATTAAATLDPELLFATTQDPFQAADVIPVPGSEAQSGSSSGAQRRNRSAAIRHATEQFNRRLSIPDHPDNGDEANYPNKIGSYSKGLPHNSLGEVDRDAYNALIHALNTGQPTDFENIPMGCPVPADQRKLVNPMAGLAFDLEGTDSHQFGIPPAPAFASAQEAGEMTELYWMALLRDVNFLDYESSAAAQEAAADLSALSDFRGPKVAGRVTTGTLFRDDLPGCLQGPYISQFMLRNTPFGAEFVERRMRTLLPGSDHVTDYSEWLSIQNGCVPSQPALFDPVGRYIRNGRDLSQWVHIDVLFQAYFNAMLILLTPPDPSDPVTGGGVGAPPNPGNPYLNSRTQEGFGTFGGPYCATITCEPATRALKAVWFQKWFVHRRLRPEMFGGRVHNHMIGAASYPIHPDVLNSNALKEVKDAHGTHLLPLAFPEGSPLHPAYGTGHGTVAGACVTILKAMFDESYVLPDPVVPSADGLDLVPYSGPDADSLTVGGELNKLASNIATGRNIAGVHWRTDAVEALRLGEAVAISILRDQRATFAEDFAGFTFTKFDGTTITV
jgi:hypothetical protein